MSAQAEIPSFDPEDKARLDRGETLVWTEPVPGSKNPMLIVAAVFEVAPRRVWALIDNVKAYKTTMPRTKKAEELYRRGNEVGTRMTVDMPFPLPNLTASTHAIHTVIEGELYRREWKLVEGDYHRNEGSWTLVPDGGSERTLLIYRVLVEPKVPIPKRIQNLVQKKAMPGLMDRLRSLA